MESHCSKNDNIDKKMKGLQFNVNMQKTEISSKVKNTAIKIRVIVEFAGKDVNIEYGNIEKKPVT